MNARARSLAILAVAALAGVAVLVGLGDWQLRRLAWKEGLIAAVESRVRAPAVEAPAEGDWRALNPADYEYRHVRVAGVYDATRQALVFRALEQAHGRYSGPGYWVMTPLRLADGGVILVNRGFVPQDQTGKAALGASGGGEVVVTGLMRASEDRNWFTPADNPASGQWFTRDVDAMARAMGLTRTAPFSIDADASGDPSALPEGGETILAFPNNHLSYALTWFGMAVALIGVFGAYAFTQLRASENPDGSAPRLVDREGGDPPSGQREA